MVEPTLVDVIDPLRDRFPYFDNFSFTKPLLLVTHQLVEKRPLRAHLHQHHHQSLPSRLLDYLTPIEPHQILRLFQLSLRHFILTITSSSALAAARDYSFVHITLLRAYTSPLLVSTALQIYPDAPSDNSFYYFMVFFPIVYVLDWV